LTNAGETFEKRSALSLQEYFKRMYHDNQNLIRVVAVFNKASMKGKTLYGSVSQEDLGDSIRCEFMVDSIDYMAKWLLGFGKSATIEQPEELKTMMGEIVEELHSHYSLSPQALVKLHTSH
jgi:predicted DNA-binding transcriptional regulator YafY